MKLDVVIFGGGAAGLWLLDELAREGYGVVLVEAHALGHGQTVASQGILHGGTKYSLRGLLTRSAHEIKDLPLAWRKCLAGEAKPDLSATPVRSHFCYLWSTDSLQSRLGMLGASLALEVKPQTLPQEQWPQILRSCTGSVSRLEEQVISPAGFIASLARQHTERLIQAAPHAVHFRVTPLGVQSITLDAQGLTLEPACVVFTAGEGNEALRRSVGLNPTSMQRRPLHMAMARGPLPEFNGHCVDGGHTRVTITSDVDFAQRRVWQVGGAVSEVGVHMEPRQLIQHVQAELQATMPGLNLSGVEWATYRVDRAEGTTRGGARPTGPTIGREGNVVTAWPTKLVLVPQAVAMIRKQLPPPKHATARLPPGVTRPTVAAPPWENQTTWTSDL